MAEVLRLAMRHGPKGVTRIAAQFPAEHAREIAALAARIAALSPGCEWSIQNERGGKVDVAPPVANPAEPVSPPVQPAPEPPKVSAIAGLWALIRGR